MGAGTVKVQEKKVNVEKKFGMQRLELNNMNIKDVSEITGLEKLKNLEALELSSNEITELKGLEALTNLKQLFLNNNPLRNLKVWNH